MSSSRCFSSFADSIPGVHRQRLFPNRQYLSLMNPATSTVKTRKLSGSSNVLSTSSRISSDLRWPPSINNYGIFLKTSKQRRLSSQARNDTPQTALTNKHNQNLTTPLVSAGAVFCWLLTCVGHTHREQLRRDANALMTHRPVRFSVWKSLPDRHVPSQIESSMRSPGELRRIVCIRLDGDGDNRRVFGGDAMRGGKRTSN